MSSEMAHFALMKCNKIKHACLIPTPWVVNPKRNPAMDLLRKISTEMSEIKLRVSQLETKHSRASATPPMS
jgi:hypothetical protein